MKTFKEDLIKIYQTERGVIVLMVLNFLLATGLFIFSVININPDLSVVRVGYGDIDGYRDGSWMDIIAFPTLAVIFGILHNLLAIKIFHKRGGGMVKFFLILTAALIIGAILVLVRILGEG